MGTKVIVKSGSRADIRSGVLMRAATPDPATFAAISVNGTTSNTRVGSWGGGGSGSINMIVQYDFQSENDIKIFFDTDGQLRLDLSHPTGTAQDNDWNASLGTRLGQVQMTTTGTTSTGSGGLSSSIGYEDLTESYQTIINGTNIGTGAYTTNDVLIESRFATGDPTIIEVRVTLTDQHTNAFFDTVSGGTMASFTVLRASVPGGIITPTNTVTNSF